MFRFRRLSDPLPLSEASLIALRPALNAPVLNVDFLPVGPARAALMVFAEEYGGIGVAFGIRSVEGGQVAVLRNQEPIEETSALSEALEPALAEAERMGFLFDEDMLARSPADTRPLAMALWTGLMGEVEKAPANEAVRDPSEVEDLAELVLEEVAPVEIADLDDEIELDLETTSSSLFDSSQPTLSMDVNPMPAGRACAAVSGVDTAKDGPDAGREDVELRTPNAPVTSSSVDQSPRTMTLSKFRQSATPLDPATAKASSPVAGHATADAEGGIGSALGRIELRRVRSGSDGAMRRIPYLARLLSSF